MTTPEMETLIRDGRNLEEAKRVYARGWADISGELPETFSEHHVRFVRDYFRAQLRIAKGQRVRAKEIINGLVKRTGFEEFEKDNEPILAAVDIAVRGSTNRRNYLGRPIEPAFRLNHS